MTPKILAAFALAAGCTGAPVDPGPDDTGDPGDTGELPVSACPEGCWAEVDVSAGALYVCAGGDDDGDGSVHAPFATVAVAVFASREAGAPKTVLIGSGEFTSALNLLDDAGGGGTDDGLLLAGCGVGATALVADDPREPVIRVSGAGPVGVHDLTLMGGRRSLVAWQGATVTVERVDVLDATRLGVVLDGPATRMWATDLWVCAPAVESVPVGPPQLGYGIAVQEAGLHMVGGGVEGAVGVGVLVTGYGDLGDPETRTTFDDVEIRDTRSDGDGALGRGLMIQEGAQADVLHSRFIENADAGVFALRAPYVSIVDATVRGTRVAALPGEAVTTGDGVVITRGTSTAPIGDFAAVIRGVTVEDSERAGVVLSGVTAHELTGNALSGNVEVGGAQILLQDGAGVRGAAPDPYTVLLPEQALRLNDSVLDSDIVGL